MIRKAIIAVLTLGAALVALQACLGANREWRIHETRRHSLALVTSGGCGGLRWITSDDPRTSLANRGHAWHVFQHVHPYVDPWKRSPPWGLSWKRNVICLTGGVGVYSVLTVGVPLLGLSVAFAAYPFAAFIRGPVLRPWRRRRKGLCLNCGYDLRGNVSGVCPECGREAKPT